MTTFLESYINQTVLCGEKGFNVWDEETNNFGECFQDLLLILPAQVLGLWSSIYYSYLTKTKRFFIKNLHLMIKSIRNILLSQSVV